MSFMPSAIRLSGFMLSVVMLSVVMISVIMLNVMAPRLHLSHTSHLVQDVLTILSCFND
jgi:hypothetical protein